MELNQLTQKDILALKKWRSHEKKMNYVHELIHFGKISTLKLTEKQIFAFMQIKLKY